MQKNKVIEVQNLRKTYRVGSEDVHALGGVSLSIEEKDYAVILGTSGSGKSTFMHLLGFMDKPTSGKMFFDGEDVSNINAVKRAWYRANKIGFVFQAFNLLPRLSVLRNVMLPLSYAGKRIPNGEELALEALKKVNMDHRADHVPNQLSGGERQRVAIARALVNKPRIIFADEPTGNLDTRNVKRAMQLFEELHESGLTIVMVTHDLSVADYAHRVIRMSDGKVIEDYKNENRVFKQ